MNLAQKCVTKCQMVNKNKAISIIQHHSEEAIEIKSSPPQ